MEFMHPDGSLLEGSLASTLGKAMVTAITDFMDEGSSDSNDSNDSSNQDRKAGHESSQAPPSLFLLASNNNSKSKSSTTNKSSRNPQRSRARQLYQLGGTCLEETAASSLATIVQCATMRTDNTSDHHRGTLPASPLPLPSSASKSTSTSTSKSLLARPVSAAVVSPCCSQDEEGDRDQEEECGTPDGNASRDHNESRSQSPSQSPQRINFYHEREDERERGDDDPNSSLESHSHSHSNSHSEPSPVRHLPPPRTSPSSYQDPFNSILDDDRKATDSPGRRKIHRPRSKRRMFGSKVTSKFFCGGSGSTYEPEDEIRIPSCPLSSPSPSSPSALSWCGGIPSILAYGGDGGDLPKQPCRDPFCGYLADLSPQRQYAFDEDDDDDDDNDVHVTDGYHKGPHRHSTSVGSSTIPALVEDDESLSSSSEDCKHDHDANHHHQHQHQHHQHHHHCNQNHHQHRYSLVSTMDSLKSSLRKGSKSYDSTDDECTLESASVTTGTSSSVQSFMMVDQPHGVPSASVLLANALRSASIVTEHYQQRQQQQQQYQQYQKHQHQQLRYQHPKQHSLSLHEWMAPPALPSSESAESRTFSPEYALSKTLMRSLQKHLPLTKKGDSFWLRYSLIRDGASLDRLLDKVHTAAGSGAYSVLAVETVEGEVFGAFCTQPWKRSHKRWYGGGQGFLWTTSGTKSGKKSSNSNNNNRNKLQVFGSSFRNSYYQLCDQNRLVVGAGGDSGFGLALEADLSTGTSHPCATFDSPSLSGLHADGSPFGVRNVEVWTLTPCLSRVEAHGRTRVHRSEKNESNHKNKNNNNNNHKSKSAAKPPGADATPGAFTDKENAAPPSLPNPSTTTRPRNKALRR